MRVLVTGATGYIGGRLIPRLLEAGHVVRVTARSLERMKDRPWADRVELVASDLFDRDSIERALEGMEVAFYLVHSMAGGTDFIARDRRAAENFVAAAESAGGDLRHVIYLGGLQHKGDVERSAHLRSRAEVGRILRESLPTTEFRAGPIIGSGSASFEMMRYLTERLPIMLTPRWVKNDVQPIGIADVLRYLVASPEREAMGVVDIGADVLTFEQMMQVYAEVRGLMRRVILKTPVLAPELASRWVGLVTPISNRIARPLVKGVVEPIVADTTKAKEHFPEIEPISYREAVRRALDRIEQDVVETRWSGAAQGVSPDTAVELGDEQGLTREVRRIEVDAPQRCVFDAFTSLGGDKGWHVWKWAWGLRGVMDQIVGGPGLRRGRRHPQELLEGEAVDFWRVERLHRPRLLRLRAEMRVPGRAWLQFEADPIDENRTTLTQSALFEPKGLVGFLYWWSMYPIHLFIFSDMVRAVGRDAESIANRNKATPPRQLKPSNPPPTEPAESAEPTEHPGDAPQREPVEPRHGQQPATSESA